MSTNIKLPLKYEFIFLMCNIFRGSVFFEFSQTDYSLPSGSKKKSMGHVQSRDSNKSRSDGSWGTWRRCVGQTRLHGL